MRFARQSAIFRGPLDPAPVVGVLFLLVIFMLLGSLLYTPGVLVSFAGSDAPVDPAHLITITRDNDIIFDGKTNSVTNLDQLRNGNLKNAPDDRPYQLKVESGADQRVVEKVQAVFPIELPVNDAANLTGTDNPTVVVAVNFRGQCFFENQAVDDRQLRSALRLHYQEASRASKKLTMVLWADKAAENQVIMRLYQLGRDAGISEFLLAERPSLLESRPTKSQP